MSEPTQSPSRDELRAKFFTSLNEEIQNSIKARQKELQNK